MRLETAVTDAVGSADASQAGQGPTVPSPVPETTWGRHCNRSCSCLNGATCLPHNGSCVCSAGYRGPECQHICGAGSFGARLQRAGTLGYCVTKCAHWDITGSSVPVWWSVCQQLYVVTMQTGSCHCPPGWTGRDCSEQCRPGTFGLYCAHVCYCPANTSCNPHTGVCVCASGLAANCIQVRDVDLVVPVTPVEGRVSWGSVVGIVLLVALLLLLLTLLLVYRRRQADKQSRIPTVAYSATRTVNSEYMVPDVPHSYHHYYYNPSYHTLTQSRLPLPQIPNNQDRSIKNTNNQLFCNGKRVERERLGPFGPESNATLPADWKHDEASARKHQGAFGMDRRHSYSTSLAKYYNTGLSKDTPDTDSCSSLNSENLYATIKDLPEPVPRPQDSGYMEMTPLAQRERSYAEISLPPPTTHPLPQGHKTQFPW
ncbi:hypothetical protein SKAU_G00408280 [Synaphobranchus kaupii]|uniref:EGF-like domain-containing protein n=1 Tax=Synaphobranchus kaupii TaxID=118154 RepID=A0A9Q1ID12_SYNKA|nr:hypothetical protein SKAU_G00408280 [Synaphobranchus kaupii]